MTSNQWAILWSLWSWGAEGVVKWSEKTVWYCRGKTKNQAENSWCLSVHGRYSLTARQLVSLRSSSSVFQCHWRSEMFLMKGFILSISHPYVIYPFGSIKMLDNGLRIFCWILVIQFRRLKFNILRTPTCASDLKGFGLKHCVYYSSNNTAFPQPVKSSHCFGELNLDSLVKEDYKISHFKWWFILCFSSGLPWTLIKKSNQILGAAVAALQTSGNSVWFSGSLSKSGTAPEAHLMWIYEWRFLGLTNTHRVSKVRDWKSTLITTCFPKHVTVENLWCKAFSRQ